MKLVLYPVAAQAAVSPATLGHGMRGMPQPELVPIILGESVVVAKVKGHRLGP